MGSCIAWCTPPRKIRAQFQEYKHTSLIFLVGKFSEVCSMFVIVQSETLHEAYHAYMLHIRHNTAAR
jgi:hypothetical protein